MPADTIKVRVTAIRQEAEGIRSFLLADPDGRALPAFTPGAHVSVILPSGDVRQYSLCGDPDIAETYMIAVQREERGRGGSRELYDRVRSGDFLDISWPTNNFPIAPGARRHVFIAGGIGITPIFSMIREIERQGGLWQLHYCVRSLDKAPFLATLARKPFSDRMNLYVDDGVPARGIDVAAVTAAEKGEETYLYCCGPTGLMNAVRDVTKDWPAGTVRFESFSNETGRPAAGDRPFEVEIENTGQVVRVLAGETILEVLRRHGVFIPSLCTQGVCGTCVVELLDGVADHRDAVLTDDLRASRIAVCCSRAITDRLKIRF